VGAGKISARVRLATLVLVTLAKTNVLNLAKLFGKEIPCGSCANDEPQTAKQVNPSKKTQSLFIFIFRSEACIANQIEQQIQSGSTIARPSCRTLLKSWTTLPGNPRFKGSDATLMQYYGSLNAGWVVVERGAASP
jgi:hypothetical protein